MAIGSGLNIYVVSKLREWDDLTKVQLDLFRKITEAIQSMKNFAMLRQLQESAIVRRNKKTLDKANRALKRSASTTAAAAKQHSTRYWTDAVPIVPYIGLFTKDFTAIDVNEAETNSLINCSKLRMWGETASVLLRLQDQDVSCVPPDAVVENYLNNIYFLSTEKLHKIVTKRASQLSDGLKK
eukprot:TRINITY_DN10132_c0_g3_i2.p1 TRINITY_DN10132_c0_g3~~TRINITY_DN10132_c0_g3_i2.p1  ORF type:complete len:183 (+),score=41.07 TRINITY_DN10132_c0_g3_i2:231-779(+)